EQANQQIRDERRRQILHVAAEIFARRGLAETRISDIAEASGISQGLIYRYFSSKEELFKVLIETSTSVTATGLEQALKLAGSPWEKLTWLTTYIWEGIREHPAHFQVVLYALISEAVPADIRTLAFERVQATLATLRQLISEGQQAGQVAAGDPDELALLYGALIQGLASSIWYMPYQAERPSVEMILRILKP
ncbi:MAG: TetR/AcrR family transcriptional regulator, partial [Thermogemmatispora sp.]|uniref:TetR/AcrR family transcriptional regulator n=1 Tax=Thermogemmatispora sp. TaxID=1968838 RepID=UPI001D3F5BAE